MHFCDYGCGREATHQFKNGKWCCGKHYGECSKIKEKKEKTTQIKYGVINPFQSKEVQEKSKQTMLKKFGVENPLQNREVQEKIKQTCMEKYGVDNPLKNKEVQEKKKQTVIKRYGVDNPSQSEEIKNKKRKTLVKNYSVENPSQSEEIQEKKKQIFIEKYGVDSPLKSKKVQEKIKQTCMEKYGVNHHKKSMEAKENLLNKHPFFCQVEEIKIEDNQFKVHCKNSNCQNSKEKGGWFTPTNLQINNRITSLESEVGCGGSFLYCSQHCKTTCDAFNVHGDPERDNQLPYTQEQLQTFRLEVLTRDNYICQYCGGIATDVHHEKPVKLYPESALDPDYGWSCCEKCHYAKGHPKETSCSTGNLAAVVCKLKEKRRRQNGTSL